MATHSKEKPFTENLKESANQTESIGASKYATITRFEVNTTGSYVTQKLISKYRERNKSQQV